MKTEGFELLFADRLWAFVGAVVLGSIVIHGVTSSPIMALLDRWRDKQTPIVEDGPG